MNLILFTFIALQLCNCALSTGQPSALSEFQRGDSHLHSDKNKLKITDLNSDVLFLIFSDLDIEWLLNTAEAFPKCYHLVRDVFRHKYSTYELQLKKQSDNSSEMKLGTIFPDERRFDVYGTADFDLRIIKVFGDIFHEIKIGFLNNVAYSRWEIVSQYVNKYCSKTVKRLELKFIDQKIMNYLTMPFEVVNEFSCSIISDRLNTTQPFNQLFPKLRHLNLYLYSSSDYRYFDCEIPNLEHLTVTRTQYWREPDQIRGLLEKNPNIRRIDIISRTFPPNYIEVINRLLPNIEHLTMTLVNIKTESIRFANVKSFNLAQIERDSIGKLSLPNLKSFQLIYDSRFLGEWQQFFKQHSYISHLHLEQTTYGYLPIDKLLNDLPNLIDVHFKCVDIIPAENIITFIENHKNLRKMQLLFREVTDNDESLLRKRFENEWIIIINNFYQKYNIIGYNFDKKN